MGVQSSKLARSFCAYLFALSLTNERNTRSKTRCQPVLGSFKFGKVIRRFERLCSFPSLLRGVLGNVCINYAHTHVDIAEN